jgi:hypothetical protein
MVFMSLYDGVTFTIEKEKEMNVVSATPDEIGNWCGNFIHACQDRKEKTQVIISFGGDRLPVNEIGGGFFAKEGDEVVGVISFAQSGEYNEPNIIGLWVKDHNTDVAVEIIKRAIDAFVCEEQIVVDVIFKDEYMAYTEEKLGKVHYDRLDIHQHILYDE